MPQLKGGSPSEPKGKDSWATLSRWCTTLSQEACGLHLESFGDLLDHQTEVSVNKFPALHTKYFMLCHIIHSANNYGHSAQHTCSPKVYFICRREDYLKSHLQVLI